MTLPTAISNLLYIKELKIMSTQTTLITYDDYRNLPDDRNRYEIIEGELFMTPAPNMDHQNIAGNIYYSIRRFLEKNKLGKIYTAPADVVLSMTNVVQPDLVFVSKEREHIITKKNIVAAPDLVIEVLSEKTAVIDQNRKKSLYEKYGVKEYWIVDPQEKEIEQYVLKGEKYELKASVKESKSISSEVVKGFTLPVKTIFET